MTIDEAIIHAREKEHEQIAEWLEELKVYQQHEIICHKGYNAGYNKAIDDFAEKLNAKCDRMIKDDIYDIADQLKWRR